MGRVLGLNMDQPKTDPALLERLAEAARNYKMTPAERFEQRVSFIWGQMSGSWTKEQVRAHMLGRFGV